MVSAKRLAANRANARKSTGPKSPDGKIRSARNALRSTGPRTRAGKARVRYNALRHGLTLAIGYDPGGEMGDFARALVGDCDDAYLRALAARIAQAQFDLTRVARARLDVVPAAAAGDPIAVAQLARFERYERRAWSRRQRAIREFDAARCASDETLAANSEPETGKTK